MLACLTTAIGIITAYGEYFSKRLPVIGYVPWAVVFTVLSILVANLGLGPLLIAPTKPVLLGIYPISMCIVVLSLLKNWMQNQQFVFMSTLTVVIPLGVIEGLKVASFGPLYRHAYRLREIQWGTIKSMSGICEPDDFPSDTRLLFSKFGLSRVRCEQRFNGHGYG